MITRRVTQLLSRFPTATIRRFALTVTAVISIAYGLGVTFGPGWGFVAFGAGCLLLDHSVEDDERPTVL